MGIDLFDCADDEIAFSVNFWHWRAIVEAIRSTNVLPTSRIDQLHEPFVGELSATETTTVGKALRDSVIPHLLSDERLLLDGTTTSAPDDGVFHKTPETVSQNYSTNKRVLSRFADFCIACEGFRVT